jgi:tRNA A-37 threonylcarbamoyl transferase component Bud32
MVAFDVTAGEQFCLEIEARTIDFIAREHPNAPGMAHAVEGGKATVFRVTDTATRKDYALKVMRMQHRDPELVAVCERQRALRAARGLAACDRICLTQTTAAGSLQRYHDLEYAILMQWMTGRTWFDAVKSRAGLARDQSLRLALRLASVLQQLERHQLAHCDISGGNVIFDAATLDVELIDVEDMYGPGFARPRAVPAGTQGYQHRTSASGQWCAEGDRFAGAVLLAEMLGWCDRGVRAAAWGESYFDPAELQLDCERYALLRAALDAHGAALGALLDRAWRSADLAQCPSLADWHFHLQRLAPRDAEASAVVGWPAIAMPLEPRPAPSGTGFTPLPETISVDRPPGWTGPIAVPAASPLLMSALPTAPPAAPGGPASWTALPATPPGTPDPTGASPSGPKRRDS